MAASACPVAPCTASTCALRSACCSTVHPFPVTPLRSSWWQDFRADVRASGLVRAVESGLRGMGSATWTATSWTTSKVGGCAGL